jgi:hypothetical protein
MSFGAGYGNGSAQPGGPFSREEEDAAEQTFEFQRLTANELGTWPPPAPPPAGVTRDLQRGRMRRRAWIWLVVAGVATVAAAGIVVGMLWAPGSGSARQDGSAARHTAALSRHTPTATTPNPVPAGLASCPVGTSPTAAAIANALARSPVYVDRGSSLLTLAQVRRLKTEIGRQDPGRIRIAAVRPATIRRGGGERRLANAIASCPGDAAGSTLVTTGPSAWLVTSYAADTAASQAVAAALNTHVSLAAGLMDAVRRLTIIDKSSH